MMWIPTKVWDEFQRQLAQEQERSRGLQERNDRLTESIVHKAGGELDLPRMAVEIPVNPNAPTGTSDLWTRLMSSPKIATPPRERTVEAKGEKNEN